MINYGPVSFHIVSIFERTNSEKVRRILPVRAGCEIEQVNNKKKPNLFDIIRSRPFAAHRTNSVNIVCVYFGNFGQRPSSSWPKYMCYTSVRLRSRFTPSQAVACGFFRVLGRRWVLIALHILSISHVCY